MICELILYAHVRLQSGNKLQFVKFEKKITLLTDLQNSSGKSVRFEIPMHGIRSPGHYMWV